MTQRARSRRAWAVSLALHLLVIGVVLWGLERVLPPPTPKETPVPLSLAMLAVTPSPPPPEPIPQDVTTPPPPEPPAPVEAVPEPSPVPAPKPLPKAEVKPAPKPAVPPKPREKTTPRAAQPVSEAPAHEATPVAAAQETPPAPAVIAAPAPAPVTDMAAEDAYKALLRGRIDAHKRYPPLSRRMGEEGTVVVSFRLNADGEISQLSVVKGSGSERLDEAALEAVRQAAPFPPFPEGVKRTSWSFSLPLQFALDR